jgi:hypothetical protein
MGNMFTIHDAVQTFHDYYIHNDNSNFELSHNQ